LTVFKDPDRIYKNIDPTYVCCLLYSGLTGSDGENFNWLNGERIYDKFIQEKLSEKDIIYIHKIHNRCIDCDIINSDVVADYFHEETLKRSYPELNEKLMAYLDRKKTHYINSGEKHLIDCDRDMRLAVYHRVYESIKNSLWNTTIYTLDTIPIDSIVAAVEQLLK
jgi:hypothetical protein